MSSSSVSEKSLDEKIKRFSKLKIFKREVNLVNPRSLLAMQMNGLLKII